MKKTALCAVLALPATALAVVGINLYGLSYHLDRRRARELKVDNEINPGLGLRYHVPHSERLQWIFDAGAYRDSGRNTALLAGAGGLRAAPGDAQLRLPAQGVGHQRSGNAGLLGHLVAALSAASALLTCRRA